MKILVTGASGFVGQYLISALKLKNISFVGIVRQLSHLNLVEMNEVSDFSISGVWQKPLANCDVVIHLAARVHIMQEVTKSPLDAFLSVNLHGTINLAQAAAKAGVKRFIYISSIKVNGEYTENKPFSEDDIPCPQDPYAVSKYQAEMALLELAKSTPMEVVIIRPPLVYGAGVKANFLQLMRLVKRSIPLPFAFINNQRSMIYVGNLVDAIITCATHPKAANQVYLVSDNEHVSTPQLVCKLAQALGKKSWVLPLPIFMMKLFAKLFGKFAAFDRLTQSLVIDASKIRKQLDWQPPYTIEQGLKITADWFKNK